MHMFRMCVYEYCEGNFWTFCFFSGCVSKIHVSKLSRCYSSSQPDGLTQSLELQRWVQILPEWVPAKQNDSSCRSCMQSELKLTGILIEKVSLAWSWVSQGVGGPSAACYLSFFDGNRTSELSGAVFSSSFSLDFPMTSSLLLYL